MGLNVNNIIRITLTWRDTRFGGRIKNVLNFRGFTSELSTTDQLAFLTAFCENHIQRLYGQLIGTTYLESARMLNMSRPNDPAELVEFDAGTLTGSLIADGTPDAPQAAACVVRQTFGRGRKSLGRMFFGPLDPRFISLGELVKDPVGFGDLDEVLDCLGDPFTHLGFTMRPIICGAKDTVANPSMDIRTQRFARLVVFLKTRRVGKGE